MISKQARAFVRGWLLGLSKQAAPIQPAAKPAQPLLAYVGNYSNDNTYLKQLATNHRKAGGDKYTNTINVGNPFWQFSSFGTAPNKPITQQVLNRSREVNAGIDAKDLFEPNTKQYEAYKDWLIRRGAENQKFYHQNVLQHDPKSSIPLPTILQQEPKDRQKQMIIEGKGMAHNNAYNRFKNGIPS